MSRQKNALEQLNAMSLVPDDTLTREQYSQVGTCDGKDLATVKIKLQAEEGNGKHEFLSTRERNHASLCASPLTRNCLPGEST